MSVKRLALFVLCSLFLSHVNAQDFAGYRSCNHTGVNGVFFNPANIADSRYRWDFTLFNISAGIGNNQASFKLSDIGKTLDGDSIKNKIFSENAGPSSAVTSLAVTGPSVFFNLGKKSALALTSRVRTMVNAVDVDGKFARQLIDDEGPSGLPYTFSSNTNMVAVANGWAEFGISYARVLTDEGAHFLKGGLSLKYLAGAANASVNVDNLRSSINYDAVRQDAYLTGASGRIGLNFGGIKLDDFEADDLLSFKSRGIGADIGFMYEYRPDLAEAPRGERRRDVNKYLLRVGVAVLDIGSIKYSRDVTRSGSYGIAVGAAQRFYLNALSNADVDNFKDTLNKYPQYFKPDAAASAAKYAVPLPSTVQLEVDYHLHNKLYLNLGTQLGLTKSGTKVSASQYYNAVALTPRYEGRGFGFYLPLTYNALTKFTGGAAFRLGPLFFGSGSVLSAALGSAKQADFFIGFHFGSLQKKAGPAKAGSNN